MNLEENILCYHRTDYKTAVNLHILIESYINFGLKGVIFISIFLDYLFLSHIQFA